MKNEFKIGDKVKCITSRISYIIEGNFYYVINLSDGYLGLLLSNEKNGEPISKMYFASDQFELAEESKGNIEWLI